MKENSSLIKDSQLILAEQMTELDNHYFTIPNEIMDLGNNQQCLLKPLGEWLMGNYGSQLMTPESRNQS